MKTANSAQVNVATPPMAAPAAIDQKPRRLDGVEADVAVADTVDSLGGDAMRAQALRKRWRQASAHAGDQAVPRFLAIARDSRFSGRPTGQSSSA
jgi:hypothetical protein